MESTYQLFVRKIEENQSVIILFIYFFKMFRLFGEDLREYGRKARRNRSKGTLLYLPFYTCFIYF